MRKHKRYLLSLMLILGAPLFVAAQESTTETDVQRAAQEADREDRGEWGWLGLLGLAGLIGLKRRDRDTVRTTSRT